MVQVKNTSENSLTEEFLVIFKLFQLIGIDVMNAEKVNEESERKYGLLHRISRLTLKATVSNTYILSLTCSTMFFTFLLLIITISASLTNETASKAKNVMKNVPYRIPKGSERIKYMLRKNSVQEYSLTLWKIYIIDRSLIITCFGTLLTYGMLIGALGKQL
ncbi:uncharacterized protein TNIN_267001 [Trichonephila inaurata madagascariensis]|uniref:Uncharacterized protein n=1 Tax=Trichonephila inaurata madagascariensis TaxID=2747483 RepID=A0A8X6XPY4_9ARAC|nr:uncharacterized protein TNIN_267001 [Trichonephila inaurata madagascariensis]